MQAIRRADCLPSLKSILVKNSVFINVFINLKHFRFTFSVCAFLASGLLLGQIKMCRVVEYPFRRRTSVRQRRISAREKVKFNKTQATRERAACLH